MRCAIQTMGTVVSVFWRSSPDATSMTTALTTNVERVFARWNEDFSLYRKDSELSRIACGLLKLGDSSDLVRSTYASALEWRSATSGAFTPHRPDGIIDLNGIVKALAIAEAGSEFGRAGITDWVINAGGDVLSSAGATMRPIGITDPRNSDQLLCAIALGPSRHAVATSGRAQRGDHIWRRANEPSVEFEQVTVVAADIVTADVLATAIVAGGSDSLNDITHRWNVDVLTVDTKNSLRATPGLRSAIVESDRMLTG